MMKRGSLVVRHGQKGVITYMQDGVWTVVCSQRPDFNDEFNDGPDRCDAKGCSPAEMGWVLDTEEDAK